MLNQGPSSGLFRVVVLVIKPSCVFCSGVFMVSVWTLVQMALQPRMDIGQTGIVNGQPAPGLVVVACEPRQESATTQSKKLE